MIDVNSSIIFYQKDEGLVKILSGLTDFPLLS